MINPNLLTDGLAEKMAVGIIHSMIEEEATDILRRRFITTVRQALQEDDKKQAHDALFDALFKAINPYEKKFEAMLKRIWDEEKRILVANIKKMKKAWLQKDKVDELMYPVSLFEKKLADGTTQLFIGLMDKEGQRVVGVYDFDMIFDVDSPEVQKWLKSYTPRFGKSLEAVNVKVLRAGLAEGINAGEGIPELLRRVYETYNDWGFRRAKKIARTETLRASNKAALETYRQSGVVKKKIWVTYFDARTCPHCERLDGTIISLEKNFFDLGDVSTAKVDGKEQTLKLDYEEIDGPPLHTQCRCTVSAYIEE